MKMIKLKPNYKTVLATLLLSIGFSHVSSQECTRCGEPKTCRNFVNKDPTQDLDTFYKQATNFYQNSQGEDLRDELNRLSTNGHRNLGYDCVWSALAITDRDTDADDSVLLFYSQESIPRLCRDCGNNAGDNWNREHLWPKSRGFKSKGRIEHNDIHHLVPADKSINGVGRNNRDFGEGGNPFVEPSTDERPARPCNGCKITGSPTNGTWEPPNAVKGQVARMMLYMDVRYNDLELVPEDIATNNKDGRLGNLVTLLKWHCKYNVSDEERARNDKVEMLQGNRNPFIDRPEFAMEIWPVYMDSIWSKGCKFEKAKREVPVEEELVEDEDPVEVVDPVEELPREEKPIDKLPADSPASVWINEFHYDNVGTDKNEFVEIACNKVIDLSGYKIVLVNGKTNRSYKTITLSETCSPTSDFVVRNDVGPVQNGNQDGIALVDAEGDVLEFISYEGTLLYKGRVSVDIGVSENNNTSVGDSLQKVGTGCIGSDFKWRESSSIASKGRINDGQFIACGGSRDEF